MFSFLRSLCRSLKKEVVDWYMSLRSSVDHLKATQVEWVSGEGRGNDSQT